MTEYGHQQTMPDTLSAPHMTVLIVEDDADLNSQIQKTLRLEGFLTQQALNGADAIARAVDNPDAIMLLDYFLGDMTAREVIDRLLERNCGMPFIIMTGNGDEQIAVHMMKLGARDYLIKGKNFVTLLPRVVRQVKEQVVTEKKLLQAEQALQASEKRFRKLIEENSDTLLVIDRDGIIRFANPAAETLFCRAKEALLGTAFGFPVSEDKSIIEINIVQPQGNTVIAEMRTVDFDWEGEHTYLASLRDITPRKHVEKTLRQHNAELLLFQRMRNLLEKCSNERETYRIVSKLSQQLFSSDAGYMCMADPSRDLVAIVDAWGEIPHAGREFLQDECYAVRYGIPHPIEHPVREPLCRFLKAMPKVGYLCAPICVQGEILGVLHLRFNRQAPFHPDKPSSWPTSKWGMLSRFIEHYALFLTNVRLRETLRVEAVRDPLTGLYNRRYMEESLRREAHRAQRQQTPVGIIMIDIDHFKAFNDTHGHTAGDRVLKELGTLLHSSIRKEDIACRYGGEEFLIILPEATRDITHKRAEELRQRTKNLRIDYQVEQLSMTVSAGVAVLWPHRPDIDRVVKAADTALYQAKLDGRDRVVVAEEEESL